MSALLLVLLSALTIAPGDGDQSARIADALRANGKIELAPGDWIVTRPLLTPADSTLECNGVARIRCAATMDATECVLPGPRSTIIGCEVMSSPRAPERGPLDGIRVEAARVTLVRVWVHDFPAGECVRIHGDVPVSNASLFRLDQVKFTRCRVGTTVSGADSSVGLMVQPDFSTITTTVADFRPYFGAVILSGHWGVSGNGAHPSLRMGSGPEGTSWGRASPTLCIGCYFERGEEVEANWPSLLMGHAGEPTILGTAAVLASLMGGLKAGPRLMADELILGEGAKWRNDVMHLRGQSASKPMPDWIRDPCINELMFLWDRTATSPLAYECVPGSRKWRPRP